MGGLPTWHGRRRIDSNGSNGPTTPSRSYRAAGSLRQGPHRGAIIADPGGPILFHGPTRHLFRGVALTVVVSGVGVWGSRRARVEEMPVPARETHLAGAYVGPLGGSGRGTRTRVNDEWFSAQVSRGAGAG
jgi:hypothetical protein